MQRIFNVIIVTFLSSLALAKSDCPDYLKDLKSNHLGKMSICEFYSRYQAARATLWQEHPELHTPGRSDAAERMAELRAPRFINMPDWVRLRVQKNYNPWIVYNPAPTTWQSWEDAAQFVDAEANYRAYVTHEQPLLTENWVRAVNYVAMKGLLDSRGQFRVGNEEVMAPNIQQGAAYTEAQVSELNGPRNFESAAHPGQPLVNRKAVQCLEDQTPDFQKAFWDHKKAFGPGFNPASWAAIPNDQLQTLPNGQKIQCDFIFYPNAVDVKTELVAWADSTNASLKFGAGTDPILEASKAQRWFVSIHPFAKGNGRTSRLIMDYLLKGMGFPAPILNDQNDDLVSNEQAWADEVGQGLLRALKIAESCARHPKALGCNIVSDKP